MGDWPTMVPVKATPSPQERENIYLQLVDMFVDIVEPDIIQMVLQNRNWDVDGALEDIMTLTNSSQPEPAQDVNKTSATPKPRNQHKVKKNTNPSSKDGNVSFNQFSPSTANTAFVNPQDGQQFTEFKPKKQPKVSDAKKVNQLQLLPFREQYNYVKCLKVPFDRAVMLIKDGVKIMIILRGPPGSGKSFLAKKILLEGGIDPSAHKRHIFSTDEFFVHNNAYIFVPELLSEAHLWNQRSVAAAIREEVSPVIIDNTNTQAWEMRVYVEMAVSAGYDVEIMEPETTWFNREGELARRNVHGVPKAKIRQMLERYERNITPDMLMKQYNLRYLLAKAPPQPARNCKWRDKLSSQRNNKPKKKKSDFNSKSQSNLDSINSMFQSFQINSPCYSQVENDFSVQNGSRSYSVPHRVSTNNLTFAEELKVSPKDSRCREETKTSHKDGESTEGVNFDESDTNKLFENLVKSSSSFFKSFNEAPKSFPDPVEVPKQSNGIPSTGLSFRQPIDAFDFMTETKKLLEALNRPSSYAQSSTTSSDLSSSQNISDIVTIESSNTCSDPSSSQIISEIETVESSSTSSDDSSSSQNSSEMGTIERMESPKTVNIFVCKEREIFLPDEQHSNQTSQPSQNVILEDTRSLSIEEKVEVAHDLVDSIIEKAVSARDLDPCQSRVGLETESGRGLSWDYVVVNNDNTFTYQRRDSIPFGLPLKITNDTGLFNLHIKNTISTLKETNLGEVGEEDTGNKLNSREKEPVASGCELNLGTKVEEDVTLTVLTVKNESFIEDEETCDLNSVEVLVSGTNNSGFEDTNEEPSVDSGNLGTEMLRPREKSVETENNTNPNVFEMMKDILYTLGPISDSYSSGLDNNTDNNLSETKSSNIEESTTTTNNDKNENPFIFTSDHFADWNAGQDWNSTKNHTKEESQPKPPRSLKRPKLTSKPQFSDNDYSKYFGDWNTVSNPAETWGLENAGVSSCSMDEAKVLPQRVSPKRSRNNKKMADSSTNTHYLDFTLLSDENPAGAKVLTGNINNVFPQNVPEATQNIAETLFLDKSTMTVDESTTSATGYDTSQISSLFPNIPEKYIIDMVERCQGDIDWAVDVLLDSEHMMAPVSIESNDDSNRNFNEVVEPNSRQTEVISDQNVSDERASKREPKSPTYEQTELKRLIESSVVFDRSHYSDKVLKIVKRKHPEYVQLIENNPSPGDRNEDESGAADSQDGCKTEDEVDEVEEESSGSGCEVETEDDTMDLVMNNDLILQLQQKFGTSPLPQISDMTPIVKLPVSFARQLYGYIMDSLQSDMDQQQSLIEEMIARDEEVARLLQFQDQNSRPQLQEVMDMEIALAMHRADQEEWKEKGTETLAAKLSKNILLEKFPTVDPRMLTEVLQAHDYSLADTVASLTLGLGVGPAQAASAAQPEPHKEEKERVTSIIVSDEVGAPGHAGSSANHRSEAEVHRAQAASYYSLRMECLNKAHDALRSGNKTVATYYSQLAQIHRERMEQSNSKAAACLFATHKTGANTLDLHFLHIREAEVVLDMFLDEVVTYIMERNKRHQTVFLITGRGLRSVGGVSRIKPMVQRKLQGRGIPYNEVNPGMLSALVRNVTPLSYTL